MVAVSTDLAIWLFGGVVALAFAYLIYRSRRDVEQLERQQHELQQALRVAAAGETRFRALLEAAPDGMITVAEDGRILLVNSESEALFGYTREELIGQSIEMLLPERLRGAHVAHRHDFYQQPRRRPMGLGLDLVARRKDGSEFPTEISLSPLQTDEGHAVIVVVRDVTDRKKADEERSALVRAQAAREEAEAASRAKDDFVAMVSHELRTPLNAMLGWAVMLRTKSLEPAVADRGLAAIERNARAQRQVIDDLLDVSRMITGKVALDVQQVDVAEIVNAAADSVRPATEAKRLRLEVIIDSTLPPALADPTRLQQVLWNLLSNAVKFTPEGGSIRVSAMSAGADIELQVADTGVGISPAFLPHVFDRFRQRDSTSTREYGGLGLGLAIVRQLVELHGGTVQAHSAGEARGSTFTVVLPVPAVFRHRARRQMHAVLAKARPSSADIPDLHGIRVMVVDDDAETRDLLQVVLAGAGAEVTTAASGDEALAQLALQVPDVLMSDIAMPRIDGYELIRRVHEQQPALPSIALTAHGNVEDRDRAEAAGFEKHLAKPVLPRDLLAIVARAARKDHRP